MLQKNELLYSFIALIVLTIYKCTRVAPELAIGAFVRKYCTAFLAFFVSQLCNGSSASFPRLVEDLRATW